MRQPIWKIAGVATLIDALISLPYIVGIHALILGDKALTEGIVQLLGPYWVKGHYPAEYLVFAMAGGHVIHDPIPLWLSVLYFVACFAQTFLVAGALAYVARWVWRHGKS